MKKISLFFLFAVLFLAFSCKKEKETDQESDYKILTEEDIYDIASGASDLAYEIQDRMFSFVDVAADSGIYIEYPQMPEEKSAIWQKSTGNINADGWTGPDANGWYTYTWEYEGLYDYTEKVRCNDTIVEYEYKISYHGGDGSYDNTTRILYRKYEENGKELYRGYWDWTLSTFGDLDISNVHWQMTFEDWDPTSGAGIFDWYWGATSNGNTVPYYRYLNVSATDAGDEWLNIRITFYDGSTPIWSFEYTSPWEPVEMPDLHSCAGN
jgi:hypothetical protein